jgi:hypothetical protein
MRMFRWHLEIEERISMISDSSRAVVAGELGHFYVQLHKFSEAKSRFDEAIGIFDKNPDDAPLVSASIEHPAESAWRESRRGRGHDFTCGSRICHRLAWSDRLRSLLVSQASSFTGPSACPTHVSTKPCALQ